MDIGEQQERTAESPRVDLKERTKLFALAVIRLYAALPHTVVAQTIGKQVLRAGTSVGAQYCEGVRGRSSAEYAAKVQAALQELEETRYWLDLLVRSDTIAEANLQGLNREADQLAAMLSTCAKNARSRTKVHS